MAPAGPGAAAAGGGADAGPGSEVVGATGDGSAGMADWREVCSACGRSWSLADRRWLCACGGLLDLLGPLANPLPAAVTRAPGEPGSSWGGFPGSAVSPLARYRDALPPGSADVDLGMTMTPLTEIRPGVLVKADFEQPTGSFKDRGAAVMLGVARRLGVDSVVVDSSGNAGKSAAAHAGRAGMACMVFLPEGTAPAKVAGIAAFGATVVEVPGGRAAAAAAAQEEVSRTGRWYASHVHQPLFHHGVKTLAFELFEQMAALGGEGGAGSGGATGGGGGAGSGGDARPRGPGAVVVPVGNGTLVLGLWLGFGELVALGLLPRRPALIGVQAALCAPIAGLPPAEAATAAAGIAITAPPRAAQVRGAVLASGGRMVTVSEEQILSARDELGRLGFDVEPTGAVAWAALSLLEPRGEPTVAVLTGR